MCQFFTADNQQLKTVACYSNDMDPASELDLKAGPACRYGKVQIHNFYRGKEIKTAVRETLFCLPWLSQQYYLPWITVRV